MFYHIGSYESMKCQHLQRLLAVTTGYSVHDLLTLSTCTHISVYIHVRTHVTEPEFEQGNVHALFLILRREHICVPWD